MSDSEVRCPGYFLNIFPLCQYVEDFENVLRLHRVITSRHSMGFQCNLVHEQATLCSTNCLQKIYDLFLSLLHNYGFSKKWHFANYTTSIRMYIWRVWVWIPYQTQKLVSHVLFQSMAKLSINSIFYCHKSLSGPSVWTGAIGRIPVTLTWPGFWLKFER